MAARYNAVASAPNGMYALIDYVNFKGEGTNPAEQYRGQGWGLRQVLEEMRPASPGQPAAVEFAEAAKRVLQRRVDNSPSRAGRGSLAGRMEEPLRHLQEGSVTEYPRSDNVPGV